MLNYSFLKRLSDLILALIFLTFLIPIFLLIAVLIKISSKGKLYHFANNGVASWYDFSKAILAIGKINCSLDCDPKRDKLASYNFHSI